MFFLSLCSGFIKYKKIVLVVWIGLPAAGDCHVQELVSSFSNMPVLVPLEVIDSTWPELGNGAALMNTCGGMLL
jgi:hypothetical protein